MADLTCCVYVHSFPHGKRYVGITSCDPLKRWQNGTGYGNHRRLINAILKYGWNNVDHRILFENLSQETAYRLEQIIIAMFRSNEYLFGYNRSAGGEGTNGCIPSEETRHKMSVSRTGIKNGFYGKHHSAETKEKLRLASTGQTNRVGLHHTEEAKRKIGNANRGRISPLRGIPLSAETKQKSSDARKTLCQSAEFLLNMRKVNPNKKTVYQYNQSGELVRIWDSRHQAENEFLPDKKALSIGKCCQGDCDTAYGYTWSYKKIDNPALVPVQYRARNVHQYDLNGNLIYTWSNLETVIKTFRIGTKSTVISQCVSGHRLRAYGYCWSYNNGLKVGDQIGQ